MMTHAMRTIPHIEDFITSADAAEILGKSRSQVNRMAAAGKLASWPVGPGGARLFLRADVEALVPAEAKAAS